MAGATTPAGLSLEAAALPPDDSSRGAADGTSTKKIGRKGPCRRAPAGRRRRFNRLASSERASERASKRAAGGGEEKMWSGPSLT